VEPCVWCEVAPLHLLQTRPHTSTRSQGECLSLYAGACARGRDNSGGALIDPLYHLHATRLKLLVPVAVRLLHGRERAADHHQHHQQQQQQQDQGQQHSDEAQQQQHGQRLCQGEHQRQGEQQQMQHGPSHTRPHEPLLLKLLSRHCFLPHTSKHLREVHQDADLASDPGQQHATFSDHSNPHICQQPPQPPYLSEAGGQSSRATRDSHAAVVDLLFEDCMQAMSWCAEEYKKGTGGEGRC